MVTINDVISHQQYRARTAAGFIMEHYGTSAVAMPTLRRTASVGRAVDVYRVTSNGDFRLIAQLEVVNRG